MVQVLWETKPTARQHHTCTSCGRPINPGETYWRTRLIGDDGPYTCKSCEHCTAFVALYLYDFCPDPHEGWYAEDVEEWEPDTDVACEHKRRFLIQWRHGRDLYPIPGAE